MPRRRRYNFHGTSRSRQRGEYLEDQELNCFVHANYERTWVYIRIRQYRKLIHQADMEFSRQGV